MSAKYDIERYPAQSGRLIGEDGEIYNLVDLLKDIALKLDEIKPAVPTIPTIESVTSKTDGASIDLS